MEAYQVVGKSIPRVDAKSKALGEARYTGDITLPGMLWGKLLRSPHPHARILSIDTSWAKAVRGVKAVITGADVPPIKCGTAFRFPQFCDEYMIALDRVRYIGETVAAVAAVNEDVSQEALDLIRVDYEPLPAVFDTEEAMAPGAPLIHEHAPGNLSMKMLHNFGDVERGFAESDHIREDTFLTQPQAHAPLECHAVLAEADAYGKVTFWASKQHPFRIRYALHRTMEMPEGMIRVIKPHVGGGFGGKAELLALDLCAGMLAKLTSRPVRILYSREESLTTSRCRHPMRVEVKTGVRKDGTLVAQSCRLIADGGAYNSWGPVTIFFAGTNLHIPYKLPNLRYEGFRVYTNKQPSGAMRGHGMPQPRFAVECQMDMIAEDLGLDPVELRLRNAVETGYVAPNGIKVTSCGFRECLEKSARTPEWVEKRGKAGTSRGVGLAAYGFPSGSGVHLWDTTAALASAFVRVEEDGTVHVISGASDIGQGLNTVLTQVVAEELGVQIDDIRLTVADTETTPLDWGTGSSRGTFQAGNAAWAAAKDAKAKLMSAAASELEARPTDLEAKDGRIYVMGSPERSVTLSQAARAAQKLAGGAPIVGAGSYQSPIEKWPNPVTGEGNYSPAYAFGVHMAEVEVDRETGGVELLKVLSAHDCGFAINPQSVQGQVEGASVMGMGYALSEDLPRKDGAALNPSFTNYQVPTCLDSPEVDSIIVESIDPGGPFGAKEAGEGLMMGIAPAVANAVYDAIGVRITSLPITREAVLKALDQAKTTRHRPNERSTVSAHLESVEKGGLKIRERTEIRRGP